MQSQIRRDKATMKHHTTNHTTSTLIIRQAHSVELSEGIPTNLRPSRLTYVRRVTN